MLSVDKAEVVVDIVERVNVTMSVPANETAPKTKAELKAEAKMAKQACNIFFVEHQQGGAGRWMRQCG